MTTVLRGDKSHFDGAAQVWAAATAARDGDLDVVALEFSRPVISEVLDRPGAVLVVALDDDAQVVAFAIGEPVTARCGPAAAATRAEIRYIGVQPGLWGTGLGRNVMQFLAAELAAAGFLDAQGKLRTRRNAAPSTVL